MEATKEIKESFYVDIKGSVKKPGVYEMQNGAIVNDVIKQAGGLSKDAYTKNINLSQLLKSEMVIYVFSKSEIKKSTTTTPIITDTTCTCETIEVDNCIKETTKGSNTANNDNTANNENSQEKRININTASKSELMTIPNIGSSKADAIIIYRQEQKFKKIEDIKNVSGIGDALFDKIKDYITVQ